CQYYYSTPYSF
nr:immunoglobulin light chain junction region [Macaca mulatta]MPO01997.1 immunoglobulin light chain junction region [Macaca mulatta]